MAISATFLLAMISPIQNNDEVVKKCEELLAVEDGKALEAKYQRLITSKSLALDESKVAQVLYASILLHGANHKGLTKTSLSRFGMRMDKLATKSYSSATSNLIRGWWLQLCAPALRMRTDPGKKMRMQIMLNGKRTWIEGMDYNNPDPAIEFGKKIASQSLSKLKNSPIALHYRLKAEKDLPIIGEISVRSAYKTAPGAFRWIFLKELVMRDASSKEANQNLADWRRITSDRDRPFIVQYLMAPDPKAKSASERKELE